MGHRLVSSTGGTNVNGPRYDGARRWKRRFPAQSVEQVKADLSPRSQAGAFFAFSWIGRRPAVAPDEAQSAGPARPLS